MVGDHKKAVLYRGYYELSIIHAIVKTLSNIILLYQDLVLKIYQITHDMYTLHNVMLL